MLCVDYMTYITYLTAFIRTAQHYNASCLKVLFVQV